MEFIPLTRLEPDSENVRKTAGEADIAELAASIEAEGLLQNLVVRLKPRTKTRYLVTAGGRRLAAPRLLAEAGRIDKEYAVACKVMTEANATELSLSENVVRRAMAPVEEFEAFAALAEAGMTPAEIATRFGATENLVAKRLRLGSLAPELREAMRAGHMSLDAAMAFAGRPDPDLQQAVFTALGGASDKPFRASPWQIKRDLAEGGVPSSSKRAQFLGLEAYLEAGGGFDRDLFEEEGTGTLTDPALLDRLVTEKLEAAAETCRAEGWAWVEVMPELSYETTMSMRRIYPEPVPDAEADAEEEALVAKMAALEEAANSEDRAFTEADEEAYCAAERRLDEISDSREEAYSEADKALAGAFVSIGHGGELRIAAGFVREEDDRKPATENAEGQGTDAAPEPGAKPFSAALLTDLGKSRNTVLQAYLAADPMAAFDLLVFSLATRLLGHAYDGHGLSLSVHKECLPDAGDKSPAAEAFDMARDGLALDWLKAGDTGAKFAAFMALPFDEREAIMAWCVAAMAMPRLTTPGDDHPLEQTGQRMGVELRTLWTPSTETLLGRLSKPQILAILAACGGEAFAERHASMKKGDLLDVTDRFFAGDAAHLSPEAEAVAAAWLPEGMAYGPGQVGAGDDSADAAEPGGAETQGDAEAA